MSALPDTVLTHTCSLLVNWPLILGKIWCFPQPHGVGSFFTPSLSTRPSLLVPCWLWRPTLPVCEGLIYEYRAMLVPGDHDQPLESSGAPLLAQGKLQTPTRSGLIVCMHFIISLGQKLPGEAGQAIRQSCMGCWNPDLSFVSTNSLIWCFHSWVSTEYYILNPSWGGRMLPFHQQMYLNVRESIFYS